HCPQHNEGLTAKVGDQFENLGEVAGHSYPIALAPKRHRSLDHAQLCAKRVVDDFRTAAESVGRRPDTGQIDTHYGGGEVDEPTIFLTDDPVPARTWSLETRIGQRYLG